MKTILFFDTETTGFLAAAGSPLSAQPGIVQIGWILAESNGVELFEKARHEALFNPGRPINPGATKVHGKTDAMVAGFPGFRTYAAEFVKATKAADFLCGHNLSYDLDVLFHEIDRVWAPDGEHAEKVRKWKADCRAKTLDTMHIGTGVCKIPKRSYGGGYKWPSLTELHHHFFREGFEGAHDAMGDIAATMRCFARLLEDGHVPKLAEANPMPNLVQ